MTTEPPTGPTVLLVEDDSATRAEVARNLRAHGYGIVEAESVRAAIRAWEMRRSDVVLLDLGLPDGDGLEVVRLVRSAGAVPIVILSARGEESTKVAALEQGADDYVTKPFSTAELQARIRAVLRRTAGGAAEAGGVVRNGPLEVDPVGHAVTVHGAPVTLVPREFQILLELLSHPGRLVTRGRLLRAVWGEAYRGEDHYIHVYVSQIRKKLAAVDVDGELTDLLTAEPGVGYRVRMPPQP
jgi:two-component system, OmpR family, KDP operon response regulator KdpE